VIHIGYFISGNQITLHEGNVYVAESGRI